MCVRVFYGGSYRDALTLHDVSDRLPFLDSSRFVEYQHTTLEKVRFNNMYCTQDSMFVLFLEEHSARPQLFPSACYISIGD